MNIGIIVSSKTGNTLSVAEKLQERLQADGHNTVLEHLHASNESEMDPGKIELSSPPAINGYDMLVFASPVNGFRLGAVMQAYLESLPSLEEKLLAGFVTEGLPLPAMGGNQAIAGMQKLLNAKGGKLSATGIINWMAEGKKSKQTAKVIEDIAAIC